MAGKVRVAGGAALRGVKAPVFILQEREGAAGFQPVLFEPESDEVCAAGGEVGGNPVGFHADHFSAVLRGLGLRNFARLLSGGGQLLGGGGDVGFAALGGGRGGVSADGGGGGEGVAGQRRLDLGALLGGAVPFLPSLPEV